jgi:ribosomal protein S18 acetylase RimI-like enzyme
MLRPDLEGVPAVGLPAGIEVRRASAEHYRAIWQAHEEAARDRWGHVTCRENGYEEWLQNPANQPDLWQVAWDGDQVAGLAMASISAEENASLRRQRGRVDSLVVRRAWRRRGLGRALVARSLARLRDSGMAEAASEVDVEDAYGAMRLFSGLGYRPVRRTAIYRRPLHGQ